MKDALKEAEMKLICEYNLLDMDILKVGHHGSKNSSNELFISTINPKIYNTNKNGMIRLILKKRNSN